MDLFLYDNGLRHERVKESFKQSILSYFVTCFLTFSKIQLALKQTLDMATRNMF